jgi:oligopeptide transport system substrate-binding protein
MSGSARVGRRPLVALVAVSVLVAASATPTASREAARPDRTVRIAIPAWAPELTAIDPHVRLGAYSSATCETLMGFPRKQRPAGYRVVPLAAARYPEVSRDRTRYTFTIRKGLRFHTGERLTAHNFAYGINRLLNPKMKSEFGFLVAKDIVGAQAVVDGRRAQASGITAHGRRLTVRLTRPVGDFTTKVTSSIFCPLPLRLPIDPEGVRAPFGGAGPYYIASWVPKSELVLRRNPFYGGTRKRHVDRFVFKLVGPGGGPESNEAVWRAFQRGEVDWVGGASTGVAALLPRPLEELRRRYGVNKSRYFVQPLPHVAYLALNTESALFRNNARLRRAVNFAVDRRTILREFDPYAGNTTDQYLPPVLPGYKNARIYPLKRPNYRRARALARGHRRGGKAVLYTSNRPTFLAIANVVAKNLKQIGLDIEVKAFPQSLVNAKLATRGEPFDLGWFAWFAAYPDPYDFLLMLEGRSIADRGSLNFSFFNSRRYNRLIARADALPPGRARYRAFGALDVDLATNAAPLVALFHFNGHYLFSRRVGCTYFNGRFLDLAGLCLK